VGGVAIPPVLPGGSPPDFTNTAEWLKAAVKGAFETIYEAETAKYRDTDAMESWAALEKLKNEVVRVTWTEVDGTFDKIRALLPDFPFAVVAWVLTQVLGLTIDGDQIKTLMTGSPTDADRIALGRTLTTLYRETLRTDTVAAGFLNRTPGEAEFTNFERLSGAAMRLQIADLVLKWIGKKIPLGLGSVFEDLADLFNDAIALDDALEEVVQVPMQAVIQAGFEQYYARQIKPQDFTESEARQALLREAITPDVYNKVLDNQGVRDDIRDVLLDMAEPNLTESDLDQLYQHNVLTEEQVSEQYKQKGFRPETSALKTKLVVGTRRWKLEEKLFELLGNLYRDGVIERAEASPHLQHFGYDPDEEEMWFQIQELERRQRKWLSNSQIHELAKAGLVDPGFIIDYQVKQGMTGEDATLLYMQNILSLYQPSPTNDPDCFKIIEDAFSLNKLLGALLSRLPVLDPTNTVNTGDFQRLLECLIKKAKTP